MDPKDEQEVVVGARSFPALDTNFEDDDEVFFSMLVSRCSF